MQFYAPFAKEIYQSEYGTSFVFKRTFEHLEEAAKFYDTTDPAEETRYVFFDHPVQKIFDFYWVLQDCDTRRFNDMIPPLGKVIQPILARLTSILQPFPIEQWIRTRRFLPFMSALASANIDEQTGRYTATIGRDGRSQEELVLSVADEAFWSMVKARRYIGCLNIQCLAGDTSAHAQLCGKCSLIRYCDQKVCCRTRCSCF